MLSDLLGECVVCGIAPENPASLACNQHATLPSAALARLALHRAGTQEPAADVQPAPTPGAAPASWDLVLIDIEKRDRMGAAKYGVRHQADNGRDHLRDAYEEALDLVVYLRAEMFRRDGR